MVYFAINQYLTILSELTLYYPNKNRKILYKFLIFEFIHY